MANGAPQGSSFAHGQVISLSDGQQAIIVQNPEQNLQSQCMYLKLNSII